MIVTIMDNYDKNLMAFKETIKANAELLKPLMKYLEKNLEGWNMKLWEDNAQLNIWNVNTNINYRIFINDDKYSITRYLDNQYLTSTEYSQRSKSYVKKFITA